MYDVALSSRWFRGLPTRADSTAVCIPRAEQHSWPANVNAAPTDGHLSAAQSPTGEKLGAGAGSGRLCCRPVPPGKCWDAVAGVPERGDPRGRVESPGKPLPTGSVLPGHGPGSLKSQVAREPVKASPLGERWRSTLDAPRPGKKRAN